VDPATGNDQFQQYVAAQLAPLGNAVNWLDTWYSYHNFKGEIHCGTNVLRTQRDDTFWWRQQEPL
jgi:protein-arginine deiminase